MILIANPLSQVMNLYRKHLEGLEEGVRIEVIGFR